MEEGVKRYMVEASTKMSPAKEKRKTAMQSARKSVVEHKKKEENENKKKSEEEKRQAREEEREEEDEVLESSCFPRVGEKPLVGALEVQQPAQKETRTVEKPAREDEEDVVLMSKEENRKTLQGNQTMQDLKGPRK